MRGIISYGTYLPHRRLDRSTIAAVAGTGGGKGTRTVASYDEDTTTLGVEAARRTLRATDARPGALWFSTVTPAYVDKTNATAVHAALRLPPADWGRLTLEFEQSRWGLVDSLRGADFGFIHVKKDDKAWLVGDRSVERLYRVVWERAGWPGPLAGRVDTSCAVTRVERSGLWPADAAGRVPGSGWQVELGLRWRFDRRLRTTG